MGRRIDFPSVLMLSALGVAALAAFWLWPRTPALVRSLRELREVRSVTYAGRADAALVAQSESASGSFVPVQFTIRHDGYEKTEARQ